MNDFGTRIDSYFPDNILAMIVALRHLLGWMVSAGPGANGATVRASVQVEAVWDGGDWKVVAPPRQLR